MSEQFSDREDGLALSQREAGMRVPQIVKAHAAQVRFRTDPAPEPVQPLRAPRAVPLRGLKDPWAGSLQCIENASGRLRQPHGSGACLAVAEEQMALAVIRPAQRQDLALAASRKQEKADDRNLPWSTVRMGRQRCGQPADLFVGQEAFAPLPAVSPDAPAGVGPLGPKAHRFRLPHDDGKHRHGAIRRNRRGVQRGEPVPDVVPADVRDPAPGKVRQELIAQVTSVHVEGPRLPDPLVTPEHGLGDGLEESFGRFAGHILAPPDRGEHRGGSRPCLADIHRRGVADDLPDALSPMLAMDEEAFAARGQHFGRRSP